MKTIKLIFVCALFLGALTVNAQDTAKVSEAQERKEAADQDREGPGVGAQEQTESNTPDENYRREMRVMKSADVPSSLRSTLQGNKYKGWENNATIYGNKNNDAFVVEMREGNQTKVHRFDKDGNPIPDQ